jgi:3-oxoacyl-[acyl-carrier protein] reductase
MAKLFSENGAAVIVCDTGEPREVFGNGEFYKLDVTDAEECRRFTEYAAAKYKKIDILVNNAGITKDGMTRKMTDEMWDAVIAVNLTGVFNLTRYIGPHMEDSGGGSIIIISSVVGEYGNIGQVNYAATKAGVIGMTKSWAKEFARKGVQVRCNAIAPGYIMADILRTVPQELLDKFAAATMLGRLGQPEEIARAALFLASDDASYITGTVLSVNGGMRL